MPEWFGTDVELEQMNDSMVIAVESADEVFIGPWLKRFEQYVEKSKIKGQLMPI